MGVVQIEITPTTKLANIQVAVAKIDEAPAGTPAPAGAVYKLLEITKKGFENEQLAGAKIKFKVEKAGSFKGLKSNSAAILLEAGSITLRQSTAKTPRITITNPLYQVSAYSRSCSC